MWVDHMVANLDREVAALNNGIQVMHTMTGTYPKEFIQKAVERIFVDNDCDASTVEHVLGYIQNQRYYKTAHNHLVYINQYGTRFEKDPRIVDKPKSQVSSFFGAYFLSLVMVWPAIVAPISLIELYQNSEEAQKEPGEMWGNIAAFCTLIFLVSLAI